MQKAKMRGIVIDVRSFDKGLKALEEHISAMATTRLVTRHLKYPALCGLRLRKPAQSTSYLEKWMKMSPVRATRCGGVKIKLLTLSAPHSEPAASSRRKSVICKMPLECAAKSCSGNIVVERFDFSGGRRPNCPRGISNANFLPGKFNRGQKE